MSIRHIFKLRHYPVPARRFAAARRAALDRPRRSEILLPRGRRRGSPPLLTGASATQRRFRAWPPDCAPRPRRAQWPHARSRQPPRHRARADPFDRRRHRRQSRTGCARRAREAARLRRRPRCWRRSSISPAIRRRTWCSSRRSRRPAAPPARRWRARPPTAGRRCWSACPGSRTASSITPMRCSTAGAIEAVRFKVDLPNYGVFDEKRVFAPGPAPGPIAFRGVRVGVPICEDIWGPDPVECILETGGEILLVPNASPYERDKLAVRLNVAVARVVESGLPLIYLNQVGGQDELVFDGASFALNADRSLAVQLPAFRAGVARTVWERAAKRLALRRGADARRSRRATRPTTPPACSACATMSTTTAFPASCSAFPAASIRRCARRWRSTRWAPARVHCGDAALSLHLERIAAPTPRPAPRRSACATTSCRSPSRSRASSARCSRMFAGKPRDITEENIQSRARGLILMAISNKFGAMVVTTGNKSEMSVGYATLYGDMNGGFNPIKDLYKMEVFRLARLRNRWKPAGRARAGRRWSSRPNDHRPSRRLGRAAREPEGRGFAAALSGARRDPARAWSRRRCGSPTSSPRASTPRRCAKVERLLYLAEYKRRQSAPGVKVGAEEFRPRPPLSDRQPLPRRRRASASPGRLDRAEGAGGDERAVRGVGGAAALQSTRSDALPLFLSHCLDDLHRLNAHAGHTFEEVDDLLLAIGETIGVELFADGGVRRSFFLVLVENPFERRAVPQPIGPRLRRHAGQLRLGVELDVAGLLVGLEHRLGRKSGLARFFVGRFDAFERPWLDCLVANVQRHKLLTPFGPLPEVGIKRDARKFTLEVERIFFAVDWIVKHAVDVVEDGVLGDVRRAASGFISSLWAEVARAKRAPLREIRPIDSPLPPCMFALARICEDSS